MPATGSPSTGLEQELLGAVQRDPVCAALLERLPGVGLPEWWLTAGAVFQNVWNHVEGRPPGYGIKDYDVFYFDDSDLSWEAEDRVVRAVDELFVDLDASVEVRNEARVHLWYEEKFGVPAAPFASATDAIDCFASTTCCVGLTKRASGVTIHAPHGLTDVFALHMRPNPRPAPEEDRERPVDTDPEEAFTPWADQPDDEDRREDLDDGQADDRPRLALVETVHLLGPGHQPGNHQQPPRGGGESARERPPAAILAQSCGCPRSHVLAPDVMSAISASDARESFAAIIEAAQSEAVIVERRGEAQVVVLSYAEYERLMRAAEEADDIAAFDAAMVARACASASAAIASSTPSRMTDWSSWL